MEATVSQAQTWLEQLLDLMGFASKVTVEDRTEKTLVMGPWLVIDQTPLSPEQIQYLLADQGAPLDAIQYLVNTAINLGTGVNRETLLPFTVELGDFRQRRQLELMALSQDAAQKVRDTNQSVALEGMTPGDRRQVHSFFEESADLETESQGQEPYRRLVIRPRR
ncbi:MAG: protein jag [Synechocystis sp.]|jgi:spoIIIJ-associated protein